MELVSRYAAKAYLVGLMIAVVVSSTFYGLFKVMSIFGREGYYGMAVPDYYGMVTGAIFYICGGMSICIGSFVLLAMLVQLSLLDIHEDAVFKLEKQTHVFIRGLCMLLANVFVGAGSWAITYSARNLEFGEPLISDAVLGPAILAGLCAGMGMMFWHVPPIRSEAY